MNSRKLGRVAEAYERMKSGKARLRAVLTTGQVSAGSIFNHIRQ